MALLTRPRTELHTYKLTITMPAECQPERATERVELFTAVVLKTVRGEKDWEIDAIDYDKCIAVVYLRAPRFRGLKDGRVVIDLEVIDDKEEARQ